jgi:predicted O-linked N-acetylglucosamine transferase (SPINDLY family)
MSASFNQDTFMTLAYPIFAALDANAVEAFLFPLGGTDMLPESQAKLPACAVSHVPALGTPTLGDPAAWRAAADHIRAHDLDLLVDLDDIFFSFSARLLMLRPARRQATWFNMSGPCLDPSIDFVIGAEALYPVSAGAAFAGKVARLPSDTFVYDPDCGGTPPPPVVPGPLSRGEPITFGSLTHLYKISPETLDLWTQVLRAVPQSRFHLANREVALPGMAARMLDELEKRGVARERVSFAVAKGWPGYLEAYREIDVALATIPVSGGTTIFQAAWQGVEVLSRVHNSPLGRIGRWLAEAIGRPSCAQDTDEGFVAEAVRIAADPAGVIAWRRDARGVLAAKSPVDAARVARAFEALARGA